MLYQIRVSPESVAANSRSSILQIVSSIWQTGSFETLYVLVESVGYYGKLRRFPQETFPHLREGEEFGIMQPRNSPAVRGVRRVVQALWLGSGRRERWGAITLN